MLHIRDGRQETQINSVIANCDEAIENGTHKPELTYEQGVRDALAFVLDGDRAQPGGFPFEDEQ